MSTWRCCLQFFLSPKPSLPVPAQAVACLPSRFHIISLCLGFALTFLWLQRSLFSSLSSSFFCNYAFCFHRPTTQAVFVLLTKEVVSIEGSFQEGRKEALVFLSHNQICYLCFYPLSGLQHKYNCIGGITYLWAQDGVNMRTCVCVLGGWCSSSKEKNNI